MEDLGTNSSWETIGGQRGFYDEQDSLHPSCNLANEKLRNRGRDEVVIFDYSLTPGYPSGVDGNPTVEGGGPSSERSGLEDDVFLRVPKKKLARSKQFDEIINPPMEPRLIPRRARLRIIDFLQCYDLHDDSPPNPVGEWLGFRREGQPAFMGAYSQRAQALPGRGNFRTGISLRAPFIKQSESSRSGWSENRFTLLVSFPYFGESSEKITLGPESESVRLLDFKSLGVSTPNRRIAASEKGKDRIGENPVEEGGILVHQARYMIFDNTAMATFRSKEDGADDEVPLYCFQERICAFRAMVHMISNRMGSEAWILEKLQASLCEAEASIDHVISAKEVHGDDWVSRKAPGLLAAVNTLSADLFAAISVAERQVAILWDLHSVFSTSYQTNTKDGEKEYQLKQNPFFKNISQTPILSEYAERVWPNILGTIEEVIRERKTFMKKIKGLVGNMDIKRKILSVSLKSTEATPGLVWSGNNNINCGNSMSEYQHTQQMQTLDGIAVMTTAFLSLSFCTSYFGMNIKEFKNPPSQRFFWLISGPVCVAMVLLTIIIISWGRPRMVKFRKDLGEKLTPISKKRMANIKNRWQKYRLSRNSTSPVITRDNRRTPSVHNEDSTANRLSNGIAKLSSTIGRATGAAIAGPKRKSRATWEANKPPDHGYSSAV